MVLLGHLVKAAVLAVVWLRRTYSAELDQLDNDHRRLEQGDIDCSSDIHAFDERTHKKTYRLAVQAIRGFEAAYEAYNKTFSEYLTATAGRRFDPPIQFEMVPVNVQGLFDAVEEESIDLFFATPGIYSCIGVETGAQPLATVTSQLTVRGYTYELDVYGGVMFARADNDAVNSIHDFHDKVIGGGEISNIMAAQLQFYEMGVAGLSYVMDPKQVVFTGNQLDVVNGVLNGEFDVGFVRTDQIERSVDVYGNQIDPDNFKVIEPKIFVLDDGNLFPFLHSTDIYPEWPVAALNSLPKDVAQEVQDALLALEYHAASHKAYKETGVWDPIRCDSTMELGMLACEASKAGNVAGFRSARSYFEVRTMHEAAGFMLKDERGDWKCTKAATLYDSIQCPPEHYKLPIEEFEKSCSSEGLVCKEGYDCYCKPCIKAYEVDVFEWTKEMQDSLTRNVRVQGCDKMSLCGSVQQTKVIRFRIVDNKERENAKVEVRMHLAKITSDLPVTQIDEKTYEVSWTENRRGVGIMEVYINNEQIPQSPIRVQVEDRVCDLDYPGQKRENDNDGNCECADGTMNIYGKCVESMVMAIVIALAAVCLVTIIGAYYIRYRNHKNDQAWLVNVDELQFDDPVEVIGQGSFGVVLLGEYRGTKVALKRALKNKAGGSKRGSKRGGSRKARGSSKGTTSYGSSGKNSNPTDSVGLSSAGMSSEGQSEDEVDPEVGEDQNAGTGSRGSVPSQESGPSVEAGLGGSRSGHASRSSGRNSRSLGFLEEDFGKRTKWGWLFPWLKKNTYSSRFKEVILGTTSNTSLSKKSWHARWMPCFNAQVRAEENFIAEMRVLARLRHPNITTVLGAVISDTHDPMLVMEYMEYGSLHDLLHNETMHLSGEIILQISRDVAQGLRFLHSSKPPILHGDLKGRNILIDARFRAKLCDFGLSVKKQNVITGTPYYLAPEYLRGQTQYTTQCDMYSMGIVFYEIYSRSDPYKGEDFRDTLRKVCDRRVNKRPPVPPTCPPKMADIMKKCWSPDPMFRYQAKDLDTTLLDMNMRDAEPRSSDEQLAAVKEKRRQGDMLYDLFPKHIADALKAGQKVEPEQHEEVTVVFSEVVNFADILASLPPMKVSSMLDRLYMAFDKVANKHSIFKVETVGDAYMGVTNLEKHQQDTHVRQAARFAIDMVIEANRILIDEDAPQKGYINVRCGFHSGPVVSNVIGSLNPRYGLFGDTVNTSSRMESNSKPNRVLCSEAAFTILSEQAPEISVRKRGKIAVKGKGDMVVYWIGDQEIQQGRRYGSLSTSSTHDEIPGQMGAEQTRGVKFAPESEHEESTGAQDNRDADVMVEEGDDDDVNDHNNEGSEYEQHQEDTTEPDVETVDEHLWRRDLKLQLNRLDSAEPDEEEAPKQQEKKMEQPQPKSTGGVKEAIHFSRGSGLV